MVKNVLEVRQQLRTQLIFVAQSDLNSVLRPSLVLKYSMMNKYLVIISCYFLYELIINGLIPTFNASEDEFSPYSSVV